MTSSGNSSQEEMLAARVNMRQGIVRAATVLLLAPVQRPSAGLRVPTLALSTTAPVRILRPSCGPLVRALWLSSRLHVLKLFSALHKWRKFIGPMRGDRQGKCRTRESRGSKSVS
jgi:hypothetical protein